MIFGSRQIKQQAPICIASLPGYAVAVQLAATATPTLAQVQVEPSTASANEKIKQLSQTLRLKHQPVYLLLEAGDYQFVQAEIPAIPAEEMKTAIRWQIKDLLRYPVDQVTLDIIAPPENQLGMQRLSGFVAASPNKLIMERMQLFQASQSRLAVIDILETAQRNIADLLEENGRATAILSLTPNGCLLTVSHAGVLYFTRNFDLASSRLAESEAARRDQFDRLVLELQRSIDVLERQFSFISLSALWLSPFPYCDELLSLLIDNLYLPVKAIELAQMFESGSKHPLPAKLDQQAALFHVLGMALREKEPVT